MRDDHLVSQREILQSVLTDAGRAVQSDHLPTLEVSGVGAVGALPGPGVVQPPDQLTTEVAPGRVVTGHLAPLVAQPAPGLRVSRGNKEGLHLDGLAETGGAGPGDGAEHVKDNLGLENMKPSVAEGMETLQRHRLAQSLKQSALLTSAPALLKLPDEVRNKGETEGRSKLSAKLSFKNLIKRNSLKLSSIWYCSSKDMFQCQSQATKLVK